MKPIDFRNATYETLRPLLDDLRRQVYEAWATHGPGTTREVATRSGIDILTLRPRTTELVDLGLVRLVENGETIERQVQLEGRDDRAASSVFPGNPTYSTLNPQHSTSVSVSFIHHQHGHEGTYIARTMGQWQQWITLQREEAAKVADGQLQF